MGEVQILTIGLDDSLKKISSSLILPSKMNHYPLDLEKLTEGYADANPMAVLIARPPKEVNLHEVAQVARMTYADLPIYLVTSIREGFDRPNFVKNGFTDAFLLPLETDALKCAVEEHVARNTDSNLRIFRSVNLIDLGGEEKLPFDTYVHLQRNNKYIKISTTGEEISPDRLDRLKKAERGAVEVRLSQMDSFYQYTADKLKALQNGVPGMSETERKQRMSTAVRSLIADLFNDTYKEATVDKGHSIIADCQEIVKKFILSSDTSSSWYEKILAVCQGGQTNHSHAGNVSSLAALFSMVSGLGKPEDLALAGLLHDIGLADVPAEVQSKPAEERTLDEKIAYQKHVEHSLNIIRFRKLSLSDGVMKAVAQHHECWSGVGYPNGLVYTKIAPEAQVLALADCFDELTMDPNHAQRLRPSEAIAKILENQNNLSKQQFNPELVKAIAALFSEKKDE